ncbi:hypothetical protein [Endozoicomonas sp. SCSIO W0465]|uniref:hypothetical protein n=1 Tax=Endozoicomonas sp. SCSIO W0465 TaxID=2918516 RepID=UPI0020751E55|nr:hypothetical protein [Endozoicomonas sp. SCSIO W0465]USE38602.1 hypothetical protein MJO57_10755 [Endozoicomonas sp. SCSIO W0465]
MRHRSHFNFSIAQEFCTEKRQNICINERTNFYLKIKTTGKSQKGKIKKYNLMFLRDFFKNKSLKACYFFDIE